MILWHIDLMMCIRAELTHQCVCAFACVCVGVCGCVCVRLRLRLRVCVCVHELTVIAVVFATTGECIAFLWCCRVVSALHVVMSCGECIACLWCCRVVGVLHACGAVVW